MYMLKIDDQTEEREDFIFVLDEIRRQISNGNTSGVDPCWSIEEVQ